MDYEVSPRLFEAISTMNIGLLSSLGDDEVRPVIPSLLRMVVCRSLDNSPFWSNQKKLIMKILSTQEPANLIITLLSGDFHSLEIDVKREQQLRAKLLTSEEGSLSNVENVVIEFEKSEGNKRLKIVLNEILTSQMIIKSFLAQAKLPLNNTKYSELFDNEVYIDEIADALVMSIFELPNIVSLIDVIETLLYFKHGHHIIWRLVVNFPEMFADICTALLVNGDKQEEETIIGKRRIDVLRMLCKLNPSHALLVRTEALESLRMPALCILLTLDHIGCSQSTSDTERIVQINDLISFLSGIFFRTDEKIRTWFVSYIRNCQKKMDQGSTSSLTPLRSELLSCLKFVLTKNQLNGNNFSLHLVEASAILRLYCALKGIAGMKFTDEESALLLNIITQHPAANPSGIRFASTALCLLLACPTIMINTEAEKKTLEWLNWLVKEESLFGQVSGHRSSFGEMLLLIAIHFHGSQISSISELVSSTLDIKLNLRTASLNRLKTMFTHEVFTNQMITAHAVKVPVTTNLNSCLPGFLPVHCIFQLLKTRAFVKYEVPIKDWLYRQTCNCTTPINPVIPHLIEAYVKSLLIPAKSYSNVATNEPISEEEIISIFRHKIYSIENDEKRMDIAEEIKPTCVLTTQLILLYYVLLYEDTRLSMMKEMTFAHRSVKIYSPQMFAQLPIFHLMQKAKNEPQFYGVLFPRLLRLISTHYPHLCLVQDWFAAEERDSTSKIKVKPNLSISELRSRLQKAFESIGTSNETLTRTLDRMLSLPNNYLWPLSSTFVDNLPLLLNNLVTSDTLEKAKKVWWQLNCIFPDNLCVMTVNSLSNQRGEKRLTWDDIVLDPLHVLRCDIKVLRCPELMEITLHVLQCFLIASRPHFARRLLEKPSKLTEEEKDREELRIALITAQESSAIQLLLECCLPNEEEKNGNQIKLKKIKKLVGVHLHQVFIADPNLVKLVHFQGYPSELLPFTVSSIPSMHICLEFIPELLSQPDLEKQIFAIQLCSYLVEQYPIVKSLCIAKLCFNVTGTLLSILESEKREQFFIPVAPALVRMCKPFPPLKEDAINLLLKLGQIQLSRLASIQPDFICTQKPLQKSADLEEIDWDEAKSFLSSLPSIDQLCHTIKQSVKTLY
ncbi:LOW QUALITY PROTEIN: integrator complex subunit 2-like [Panonychus citri]|uniref:LOW QUALITY PROTEIN: integrator complex subunit 2-like n=1 Tax=Panonychus citri TaxID=50023 RepID=UPI0023081024|nr:LOW QUALITY PROTEIN: integrator complex subunit 2-like [Panonychus citri]